MVLPNLAASTQTTEAVSKKELRSVINDIKAQIKQYGITAADLGFGLAAQDRTRDSPIAGRKVKSKAIHPTTGRSWSGKGVCPQWVKDLDLEVQRSTEPDSPQGVAAKLERTR